MNELEIKRMIKNEYNDVTDEDVNEIYQALVENNAVPKNEKELSELFHKIEELGKDHAIDDSEYEED